MVNAESLVGRQIDQFRLDKYLARGAMGMVYKAFDTILMRTVALKVIPKALEDGLSPQELAAREEARKRLIQEAKAAGRLTHPNIVTIHNYGETDEFEYICMEYVTGKTLSEILKERKVLEVEEAVPIVEQILMALESAAREHIVHRDIKPSNVMITSDNRAKVMDFGIAKLPSLAMTTTGTVLGTPYYMSPEQISGQKVDIRSDIFSTGAVLYEMLTGERPFEAENTATLAYKIVQIDPIPAKVLNVHVPEAVGKIITRALAKDPAQRYQTPSEMIQDLKALGGTTASGGESEATVIGRPVDLEGTVQMMSTTGAEGIAGEPAEGETLLAASGSAPEMEAGGEETILSDSRPSMAKQPRAESTAPGVSAPGQKGAGEEENLVFSPATVDLPSSVHGVGSAPEIEPCAVPPPPPGIGVEEAGTAESKKSREAPEKTEPPKAAAARKAATDKEQPMPGSVPPRTAKSVPAAAKSAPAKTGGVSKTAAIVVLVVLVVAAAAYYLLKEPGGPATPPATTQGSATTSTQPQAQTQAQGQQKSEVPAKAEAPSDRNQILAKVDGLVAEAKNQWQSNPKAAQQALQEAIRLDPGHFEALYQYGRFLTQWRDFTGAVQQYEAALRINNQAPDVYFNLGYVYQSQGNYDAAILNYESCRALNPSYLDQVLTNLGVVYLKKEDPAQAQVFFKQALEQNPNNTAAKNYLASASPTAAQGTVPPADTTLPAPVTTVPAPPTTVPPPAADTTSQKPAVTPAVSAAALVEKAKAQMRTDPATAQMLLEEAVNSDPGNFDANFQLARLLTQKKEYPTAIQYYLIAQRIKSREHEIYFNLGYIYMNQGDLELARMNYESCLALSPSYRDEVLTNLGIVHMKKKNPGEARAMFKQALDFNPKNSVARSYLNKLNAPAGRSGQRR
ncbi:MAG: tetratricopeptide repeat protein [Syntrophobacteraceae bacterium]